MLPRTGAAGFGAHRGKGLKHNGRWILDLYGLNERGWLLLRAAAQRDVRAAAQQFGVSRRLLHRVARLPHDAIRRLAAVPIAQFVPADRDSILAYLADPATEPPVIGRRDPAPGEHGFNLHYWHCMRAEAEQDVVLAAIKFNVPRTLLKRLAEASIDTIDGLVGGLRPEFRVIDILSIEVAAMLIEAEASPGEVAHLLLCGTTASPYDLERTA